MIGNLNGMLIALVSVGMGGLGLESKPIRIADPVSGHIHPAVCMPTSDTIVVTYGRINHRDLRVVKSTDGGQTWSSPTKFPHTVGKTYYPGSLTALRNGTVVHAWNRWSRNDNEKEPRSVLYSLSTDNGDSWTTPKPLPRNPEVPSIIRHPFIELSDNRWLVSLSDQTLLYDPVTSASQPYGDGRVHGLVPIVQTSKGTLISGAGLRSRDEGKTWMTIDGFPDVSSQGWRHEMVSLSNGMVLASQILGPGTGGERIRYVISQDDGVSWTSTYEYYNPGRAIGGRACPRTVQLDDNHIGVVFYDVSKDQDGGPGLFFLRIEIKTLVVGQ